MYKNKLRKLMINNRKNFDLDYKMKANLIIKSKTIEFIAKNGFKKICIYLANQYEVETKEIIAWCLSNDIEVYTPKILTENKMIMVKLVSFNDLELNKFKIYEPRNFMACNINEIDCIFIPLVAFDNNLNRIGMGKGFYDRFLFENKGDYLKVGLSFCKQKVDKIKPDINDLKLDFVITE